MRLAANRPKLDIAGAVLVGSGVMAALYGFTTLERDGFARPALSLAASAVLLVTFFVWERRTPVPLVRLEILRVRSLRAASCGIGVNGVNALAATSVVYIGSLYLQNALGYSAMESALAIIPINVLGFIVALVGAPLAQRSPRLILRISFTLTALSLLWLARAPIPARYLTQTHLPAREAEVDPLPGGDLIGAQLARQRPGLCFDRLRLWAAAGSTTSAHARHCDRLRGQHLGAPGLIRRPPSCCWCHRLRGDRSA